MVSVCLLLNLLIPPGDSLVTEVLGIKGDSLKAFPALACLALSVLLAHLCAALARGARLARAFGDDLEIMVVVGEKPSADATTDESPSEASLMQNRDGWLARLYLGFRVFERFLSYMLFLAILFGGLWFAVSQTLSLYQSWARSPIFKVCAIGASGLLLLAVLRMVQYWLLRVQTFGDSLSGENVVIDFPRKYSVTSVLGIITLMFAGLIWHGILRPICRLIFGRWRASALVTYPQPGSMTFAEMEEQMRKMGCYVPRSEIEEARTPTYSLWIRFLRSLWDERDVK